MDFITYTLLAFISFIGIFIGLLLAKSTNDEIHYFKKYIPFLQLVLFILTFLVLFIYIDFIIASFIFILSFAFIFLFWQKQDMNLLDYIVFSIIFVIASTNLSAHYYITAIVFTFGILSGSLFFALHDKEDGKKIGHHKPRKKLSFNDMSYLLFKKYLFFFLFSIFNYIIAQIMVILI